MKTNRRGFLKKIGVVSAGSVIGTKLLSGCSSKKDSVFSVIDAVKDELRDYMKAALTHQLTLNSRRGTIINEEFVEWQMGHVFATLCDCFREAKVITCKFVDSENWGYVVVKGKYYVGEDFLCDVKNTSLFLQFEGKLQILLGFHNGKCFSKKEN